MRRILIYVFLLLTVPVMADYNPYCDNAIADVQLRIVDDEGSPVEGVSVTAAFYIGATKTTGFTEVTKQNGIINAKYPCNGEFKVWARKTGYYDTVLKTTAFKTLTDKEVISLRKWSKDTVSIPVIIKKKKHPIQLKINCLEYKKFPVTNEVFFLDLETCQWCPPFGNGKHKDMKLFYEAIEHPEQGWAVSYWNKLTLSMPNVADGFYRAKIEPFSKFPYAYDANTNAVFLKSLVLEIERKNDRMVKTDLLPGDEYLIFRTRTETNHLGQVTNANYGRIGEKLNLAIGLSMKSWFNPKSNDTNLEDACAW